VLRAGSAWLGLRTRTGSVFVSARTASRHSAEVAIEFRSLARRPKRLFLENKTHAKASVSGKQNSASDYTIFGKQNSAGAKKLWNRLLVITRLPVVQSAPKPRHSAPFRPPPALALTSRTAPLPRSRDVACGHRRARRQCKRAVAANRRAGARGAREAGHGADRCRARDEPPQPAHGPALPEQQEVRRRGTN